MKRLISLFPLFLLLFLLSCATPSSRFSVEPGSISSGNYYLEDVILDTVTDQQYPQVELERYEEIFKKMIAAAVPESVSPAAVKLSVRIKKLKIKKQFERLNLFSDMYDEIEATVVFRDIGTGAVISTHDVDLKKKNAANMDDFFSHHISLIFDSMK